MILIVSSTRVEVSHYPKYFQKLIVDGAGLVGSTVLPAAGRIISAVKATARNRMKQSSRMGWSAVQRDAIFSLVP